MNPSQNHWRLKGEKEYNPVFRILPMKLNILQVGHLKPAGVHIFCAYTRKYFNHHLQSLLLVGVFVNCDRWLLKKSRLWDSSKLQATKSTYCRFLPRPFTFSVTESLPKSRGDSMMSLETKKIMLLYCRLKVYKTRMKIKFWSTESANGESTRWNDFCLFWTKLGYGSLSLAEKGLQKKRRFFFFMVISRFFDKNFVPPQPNNINVGFSSSKWY